MGTGRGNQVEFVILIFLESSRPSKQGLQSIIMSVIDSATNGEKIHEMFEDMFSKDVYFRLNPTG